MATSLSAQLAALRGPAQLARKQEASLLFPQRSSSSSSGSAPIALISSDAVLALARAGCEQLAASLGDPRFAWTSQFSAASGGGGGGGGDGAGSSQSGFGSSDDSYADGTVWVRGVPVPVAESHAALSLLLGESSKYVERARLTDGAVRRLDAAITHVCLLLQPYFLHRPAQQVLEWLLRQFEVHRFNVDALMMTALPYHQTNLFARLLQLLRLRGTRWAGLIPLQKEGQSIDRNSLVQRAAQLDSRQSGAQMVDFIAHCGLRCHALHVAAVAAGLFTVIPAVSLMGSTLTSAVREALNGRTGISASGTDSAERFVASLLPHIQTALKQSTDAVGLIRVSNDINDEGRGSVSRLSRAVGDVHAAGLMIIGQLVSSISPSAALVEALLVLLSEGALKAGSFSRTAALSTTALLCATRIVDVPQYAIPQAVVSALAEGASDTDGVWWLQQLATWSVVSQETHNGERAVPDAEPLVASIVNYLCESVKSYELPTSEALAALHEVVMLASSTRAASVRSDGTPLCDLLRPHIADFCAALCVAGVRGAEFADDARSGLLALAEAFPNLVNTALNAALKLSTSPGILEFTTHVFAGTNFAMISDQPELGSGLGFTTLLECAKSDSNSALRLAALKQLQHNALSSKDTDEVDAIFSKILEAGDEMAIISVVLDAITRDAGILCGRNSDCSVRRLTTGCEALAKYFGHPMHAHSALAATWSVFVYADASGKITLDQPTVLVRSLVAFQAIVLFFFASADPTWAAANKSAATIVKDIESSTLASALPLLDCVSEAVGVSTDEVTLMRCLSRAAARGTEVLLSAFTEILKGADSSSKLASKLHVPAFAAKYARLLLLGSSCQLLQEAAEGIPAGGNRPVEVVRSLVQYLVDCEASNAVLRRAAKRFCEASGVRDFGALCAPHAAHHMKDAACWAFVCLLQCAPCLPDSAIATIRMHGSVTSAMRPGKGSNVPFSVDQALSQIAVDAYRRNLHLLSSAATTGNTNQIQVIECVVRMSVAKFAGLAMLHALCYFAADTSTTLDTRIMCLLQIEILLKEIVVVSKLPDFEVGKLPTVGPVLVASLFVSLGSDFHSVRSAAGECFLALAGVADTCPLSVRRLVASADNAPALGPLIFAEFCVRVLQWSRDVANDRHAFVRALADEADAFKWDSILCVLLEGAVRLPSAIVGRKLVELIDPVQGTVATDKGSAVLRWGPRVYVNAWRAPYETFSGNAFVGTSEVDADSAWVPFADILLPILLSATANEKCTASQQVTHVGQLCEFLSPTYAASENRIGQEMRNFMLRHIERAHVVGSESARSTWYSTLPVTEQQSFFTCLLNIMLSPTDDGDADASARTSTVVRSILQSLPLCVAAVDARLRVLLANLLVSPDAETDRLQTHKRRKRGNAPEPPKSEPLRPVVMLLELLQVALDEQASHFESNQQALARVLLRTLAQIIESSIFDKQHITLRRDVSNAEYAVQLCVQPLLALVRAHNSTGDLPSKALFGEDDYSVLLNVLRVTSTPHTHNSIIALLALCARSRDIEVKQAVLRHTLPLFTYLGANSVRKDDDYTYAVVDDAVSAIVPAILDRSVSESITPSSLIKVFAEACSMVPVHRRLRLFSHLIQTLGPRKYLAELVIALIRSARSLEQSRSTVDNHQAEPLEDAVLLSSSDMDAQVTSQSVQNMREVDSFVGDILSLCHAFLDAIPDIVIVIRGIGDIVAQCVRATQENLADAEAEESSARVWETCMSFVTVHIESDHFQRALTSHMTNLYKAARRQSSKRPGMTPNSTEQELVQLLHASLSLTLDASTRAQDCNHAVHAENSAYASANRLWQSVMDNTHALLSGITRLLPTRVFMSQVAEALGSLRARPNAVHDPATAHSVERYLSLFSGLLESSIADDRLVFSKNDGVAIVNMHRSLCGILDSASGDSSAPPVLESVMRSLDLLVQVFGPDPVHSVDFSTMLTCVVRFLAKCVASSQRHSTAQSEVASSWTGVCAYAIVCVGTLVDVLGAQSAPLLPTILRNLLTTLDISACKFPFLVRSAALSALQATVRSVGQFSGAALPELLFRASACKSERVMRTSGSSSGISERTQNENRVISDKSSQLLGECASRIHPRLLLPALSAVRSRIFSGEGATEELTSGLQLVALCDILKDACSPDSMVDGPRYFRSPKVVRMHHKAVFQFLLDIFEVREVADAANARHTELLNCIDAIETAAIETAAIEAFEALVVRLSESLFKPLFVSLLKWAGIATQTKLLNSHSSLSTSAVARAAVFYRVCAGLLARLMSLFVPLVSYFSDHAGACLAADPALAIDSQSSEGPSDPEEASNDSSGMDSDDFFEGGDDRSDESVAKPDAWSRLVEAVFLVLSKTFEYDTDTNGKLVVRDKLSLWLHPLVNSLRGPHRETAKACLVRLAACLGDEKSLRPVNLAVFQLIAQAPNPAIRVCALQCAREWHSQLGESLLGLVPETVPFLAELLEDAHTEVEAAAQGLIQEIEKHLGENSIASYL